ncbi:MAG: TRAP transporter large permease subunit [Tistlia sp.]|uniref:TRAP transporter large permease subunit n=1 Tax=Tistlia sp. TaxID=3057121 RepID=UPI0034A556E2
MTFLEILPLLMFGTLALFIFTGYPVAFVLGGVGLGFALFGDLIGEFRYMQFFSLPLRIYGGTMENMVLVAIPMFIFMGTMLEKSRVAEDLLYTLQILTRRLPGGLALSVTIMGTILAATTGIIGASVVLMTLMALPVMIQRGYSIPLATGTIAASGTLGILIPPSIMLVIMADLLSISVGDLFVGAVIPGFMLSGFYLLYILGIGLVRPAAAPPLPADVGPDSHGELAILVIRSFIPPVLLIVFVLGSIFGGFATPTEAAGVGAVGATLLALANGRLTYRTLREVCVRSAVTGGMLFGIFIGATCFSFVFKSLHGDRTIIDLVQSIGLGPWGVLIALMALVFVLGFFFDWIEITLIVLPVFAPIVALLDFGAHIPVRTDVLYWFAILLAVNLQTSFLTPPFGFALFYMKGVAPPEVRIQDIYRGIVPFVLLQLIGLGLVMAFPELTLWLPRVLLN